MGVQDRALHGLNFLSLSGSLGIHSPRFAWLSGAVEIWCLSFLLNPFGHRDRIDRLWNFQVVARSFCLPYALIIPRRRDK